MKLNLVIISFILFVLSFDLHSSNIIHYKNQQFGRDIEIVITDTLVTANEYKKAFNNNHNYNHEHKYYFQIDKCDAVLVINSIFVRIGNIEINVPKEFFYDFIGVRIGRINYIRISDDNNTIIFSIPCFESGGSYDACLEVSSDGEIKRFFHYYDDTINSTLQYFKQQ